MSKKIALLFLCKNKINHIKLWDKFIQDGGNKVTVYVHADNYQNVTQDFIKKYIIPETIKIEWGDLYPGIRLLYKYALKNSNNYKFILLSDTTIPLLPFNVIYYQLVHTDKSFIQYDKQNIHQMMGKRFKNQQKLHQDFKKNIHWEHYYFNECWTILNRTHVNMILNDEKYYNIFRGTFAYDENYPTYLLSFNNQLKNVKKKQITHVNWNDDSYEGVQRHPKIYTKLNKIDLYNLIVDKSLFARKFSEDCDIDLISPYKKIENLDCVILNKNYDLNLLIHDYNKLLKYSGEKKHIRNEDKTNWSSIPLHTWNGIEGSDGNILGLIDTTNFKPTKFLDKCHYFKKILDDLNTDIYLVRLIRLKAGEYIQYNNQGFNINNRINMIRCNLPIITNHSVIFGIDDTEYNLMNGTLYYTRVDKPHWMKNNSSRDEIHLVIDIKPTHDMIQKLDIYKDDYSFVKPEWEGFTVWKEFSNNSNTLYISFAGLGINWKPTFIFYNTLSNTNYNKLFIRDSDCQWYLKGIPGCSEDISNTLKYLNDKIRESKCNKVIMIGCDAGGYASILYGSLLNVDKIVVFNPHTYLDMKTRKTNHDYRWKTYNRLKLLQQIDHPYLNLKNLKGSKSKIKVFYSNNSIDISHYKNIKQNTSLDIEGIQIDCSYHLLTTYLKMKKILNKCLEID